MTENLSAEIDKWIAENMNKLYIHDFHVQLLPKRTAWKKYLFDTYASDFSPTVQENIFKRSKIWDDSYVITEKNFAELCETRRMFTWL